MKVDEFQMTVEEVIAEVEHVTSLTPSGIECWYSWEPRRHYKLRWTPDPVWVEPDPVRNPGSLVDARCRPYMGMSEWREVPSVTSVLGVLDKPALVWWGMKVGIEGVRTLAAQALGIEGHNGLGASHEEIGRWLVDHDIAGHVAQLTENKLTVNHQKDSAAKRGVNVHSAFERWAEDQSYRPVVDSYPETEQGYIRGLNAFLDDLGEVEDVESEVMVGSISHGFAGRYDLRFTSTPAFDEKTVVTKVYPKRDAKRSVLPTGRFLVDLKTSKNVYPSHGAQLAAYELASVECGYGSTDHRAVIHVTQDGKYEFVQTSATADDFLSIFACYQTMQRAKGWF